MPETPAQPATIFAEARKSLVDDSWIDEITALDEDGEPDDYARRVVPLDCALDALDRIEAAVEREREIARDLGRIDRESDNLARAADALEKAFAPGNAAALREALGKLTDAVRNYFGWDDAPAVQDRDDPTAYFCAEMSAALAALAAPARNCDRPECADVESAWATYCAETNRADCKGFARWLFAEAEGGDHA